MCSIRVVNATDFICTPNLLNFVSPDWRADLGRRVGGHVGGLRWAELPERSTMEARWRPVHPVRLQPEGERTHPQQPRPERHAALQVHTDKQTTHTHTHSICSSLCSESVWKVSDRVCVCVCSTWSVQPERRQQSGELNPTSGELCVFHTHSTVWCMNPSRAHCIEIKLIKPKLQ